LGATLLWMRVTTRWAAKESPSPASLRWMHQAIQTCIQLDPSWQAPAHYGSLMLAAAGDLDGHERVLEVAATTWPEEPWFATALGMSRYLHRKDAEGAARWLEFAAASPGAGAIHQRAAARLRTQASQ
jgi:hypothetical protein